MSCPSRPRQALVYEHLRTDIHGSEFCGTARAALRGDSLGRRAVHFDAVADRQELGAEGGGFKSRTSAYFVEILIIFEKKFLGFAAGAQRAAAPVFNRHHDNGVQ